VAADDALALRDSDSGLVSDWDRNNVGVVSSAYQASSLETIVFAVTLRVDKDASTACSILRTRRNALVAGAACEMDTLKHAQIRAIDWTRMAECDDLPFMYKL
jgi:hypothetical protein